MPIAYIGLGANLGDRAANIAAALDKLRAVPQTAVRRVSDLYPTAPLGGVAAPEYLNGVAEIETDLPPETLLDTLEQIEKALGRTHKADGAPRPIDLDILLYDQRVIQTPRLIIPHRRLHLRSFALRGLCQLNQQVVHPQLGVCAAELLQRLNGGDFQINPQAPQLICIAGLIGVGKTTLARRLAQVLPARMIAEKYGDNPYLAQVYAGRAEMALDSELFFLASSASQLRRDRLKNATVYVADYIFDKARIYAACWLNEKQWAEYQKHLAAVAPEVCPPTVAVFLQDSPEKCLQRIRQRNRPFEQGITLEFLNQLDRLYQNLFGGFSTCPVIRTSAEQVDSDSKAAQFAEHLRYYIAIPNGTVPNH